MVNCRVTPSIKFAGRSISTEMHSESQSVSPLNNNAMHLCPVLNSTIVSLVLHIWQSCLELHFYITSNLTAFNPGHI